MNHSIKWLKQIDKAHAGEAVICPQCGSTDTAIAFFVFANGIGYGDMRCKNCGDSVHISRMKFPTGSKANIMSLE